MDLGLKGLRALVTGGTRGVRSVMRVDGTPNTSVMIRRHTSLRPR